MSNLPYDFLNAAAQGRRAIRRGDLASAERWFKLAERATAIAQRLASLEHAHIRSGVVRNPV